MSNATADTRAAIYARVSSEQQAEAGTIVSQVEALTERMGQEGLFIEPELRFIDEGYSGATLARPGLERLRDVAAAGAIDRLYVHCPDRLARKYAYQVLLVDELQRCGVELVFLNHELGQTPEEDLLLQVQGMVAEYERAKILERSRRGKLHAARRGSVNVLGGAPYGYRYIRCDQGGGEAQYQILLEQAKVVRQVFEWVGCDRLSIGEVCRRLKKQGVTTRTGKRYWDRATIWAMLKNPAYKGTAAFGKTRVGKLRPRLRVQRGACEQPRKACSTYDVPSDKWIYIPVPAIISQELFATVGEQLAENRRRSRQGKRGAKYLLQGLVVCKQCGYAYYGKPVSISAGKGKRRNYAYYRCTGTDAYRFGGQRVCWNRQVRTDLLEQAVWEDVCSLLSDPKRIEQEYQRRLTTRSKGVGWDGSEHLQSRIKKTRRGIARLIDAYEDGLVDKSEFEPRLGVARQRLENLRAEAQALTDEETRQNELRLVIGRMQEFADKVADGLQEADWSTRRELLRALIKQIDVDKEEVRIVYKVSPNPFDSAFERGLLQHCLRRNRRALRRAAALVLVAGRSMYAAPVVGLFGRGRQPHLDQTQDVLVAYATGHRLHQLGVGDAVEVSAQIRIYNLSMSGVQQSVDGLDGVLRFALGSVAILLRLQIGLENRAQYLQHGHLHHAIRDRRNTQRPLFAIGLGDVSSTNRLRTIRLRPERLCQFAQPSLHTVGLDVRELLPVHPRCAIVGFAAEVGVSQDVLAVHLVVQRVESIARRRLRFGVQRRLQLLNLRWRY